MTPVLLHAPSTARLSNRSAARVLSCMAEPSAVTVKGAHFLPEDSPEEVGSATASFVAKVLAGQIR
jgi:hypothetical protein